MTAVNYYTLPQANLNQQLSDFFAMRYKLTPISHTYEKYTSIASIDVCKASKKPPAKTHHRPVSLFPPLNICITKHMHAPLNYM
jgi:hypothetical protein